MHQVKNVNMIFKCIVDFLKIIIKRKKRGLWGNIKKALFMSKVVGGASVFDQQQLVGCMSAMLYRREQET